MQLDDGPAIPCGTSEGQVDLQGLSEGEHRLVTSLTSPGSTRLVAQHSAVFVVGELTNNVSQSLRRIGGSRGFVSSFCGFGKDKAAAETVWQASTRTVMSTFVFDSVCGSQVVFALCLRFLRTL
jgi:hypothetical protein